MTIDWKTVNDKPEPDPLDASMKFKAEDGSEWEAKCDEYKNWEGNLVTLVKKIPEKSELEKWIANSCYLKFHSNIEVCDKDKKRLITEGFKKAIEVAESNNFSDKYSTIAVMKLFTGIK